MAETVLQYHYQQGLKNGHLVGCVLDDKTWLVKDLVYKKNFLLRKDKKDKKVSYVFYTYEKKK